MKKIIVNTGLIIIIITSVSSTKCLNNDQEGITAGEVVNRIMEEVNIPWMDETVDNFKSGEENNHITGIITTFIATMEVLEKAVEMNCNMIITHEPTFYNGQDNDEQLNNDPVLLNKKKFIKDNGLVIWRFHDHWHRMKPDGIYVGMTKRFGWENRLEEEKGSWIFRFDGICLKELAIELQEKFPDADMRIIGNPELIIGKAAIILGAPWSISQIRLLERDDIDVIIAGETREWETVEYARDAMQAGFPKACILMGHAVSEEAGMEYCAEWLGGFITEVPIHFVEAGDPFWTL